MASPTAIPQVPAPTATLPSTPTRTQLPASPVDSTPVVKEDADLIEGRNLVESMHYKSAVEVLRKAQLRHPKDEEVAYWTWRAIKEVNPARGRVQAKSVLVLCTDASRREEVLDFLKPAVQRPEDFQSRLAKVYAASMQSFHGMSFVGKYFCVRYKGNGDPKNPGLTNELFIELVSTGVFFSEEEQWHQFKRLAQKAAKANQNYDGPAKFYGHSTADFHLNQGGLHLVFASGRDLTVYRGELNDFLGELAKLP